MRDSGVQQWIGLDWIGLDWIDDGGNNQSE